MIRVLMVMMWVLVGCQPTTPVGPAALDDAHLETTLTAWMTQAEQGRASSDLYFNLGHAYYVKGELGSAAAFWHAAHALSPRDGDISHNLALVRTELTKAAEPVAPTVAWTEVVTPDEVGLLGVGLVVLGVLLIRVQRKPIGTIMLLFGLFVGYQANYAKGVAEQQLVAVVITGATDVREAPRMEARRIARIDVGSELRTIARRGEFVLVRGGEDLRGWIPRERLRIVSLR